MKKFLALLLAAVMVLAMFTACALCHFRTTPQSS